MTAAVIAIISIAVAAARIVAALIALRRSIFRRRKIASSGGSWPSRTGASTASASTASSEATASTAVPASIAAAITSTVSFAAAEILASSVVSRAAIVALRILLRRIVMRGKILRRRCIRLRLALFEFVVRLDVAVRVATIGAECVAGFDYIAEVVVLVLVVMSITIFFAVLIVMRVGVCFVLMIAVMLLALVRFGGPALANGFARQNFGGDWRGCLRRAVAVRIAVAMAVIVILKIFEYVADVQERVAVETDIDEGGLHTREDAGNAAFVDATYQRELFFALDINFD